MSRTDPSAPPRFLKMHGLGNDFVIIDARESAIDMTPARARRIGDRRRGVGFDQLAMLHPSDSAAARIAFWNADGSQAGACGNATRCLADLLMRERSADRIEMEGPVGPLRARRAGDGLVTVDMGCPDFDWRRIPLARDVDVESLPLPGAPSAASMGNPHCVFFVGNAEAAPVETDGPRVETDPLFPERCNVEFVQVLAPDRVRARVWERGAGVTLACGSGACALVAAGVRRGLLARSVEVILDGGPLRIDWPADEAGVEMTGPVASAFDGVLSEYLWGEP